MPPQLRVDEVVDRRSVEIEVVRNTGIPERLPAAERVVSVNARVDITEVSLGQGYVVINGIIRSTIFYASADDPSNIVTLRRSFNFSERVSVSGARPGYEANVEATIVDIDFYRINERLLGVEFTIDNDIEITAPDRIEFIEERPEVELRRQRIRIRREVRERNYTRVLRSVERIPREADDIRQIIELDTTIQILEITTDYDEINIRGLINASILYRDSENQLEYATLTFGFNETFTFTGVTPDMEPFVEITVLEESAERVDERRVRINLRTRFTILVIEEEIIDVPTDIVTPERLYPVRRIVLVERIIAEERTRVLERDEITVPEGNPDVGRVIRANGRIRGGSLTVDAEEGGVLISGIVDSNIIYVAALPAQPVYFTQGSTSFDTFIEIPEVNEGMDAYADVSVERVTASRVSSRVISLRIVHDVNLLVTETIRVPVVVDVSERPVQQPTAPEGYLTYTVKSGDTLYLIARRYGTTVDRLVEINNIANPSQLQVGQRLLIPR